MPLILPNEIANEWLTPYDEELWGKGQKRDLEELIRPYMEEKLYYHTVNRLRGKEYPGNVPGISEAFVYRELQIEL